MKKKWEKFKVRWIVLIAAVSCAVVIPFMVNDVGSEADTVLNEE